MKRIVLSLATVSILAAAGCSRAAVVSPSSPHQSGGSTAREFDESAASAGADPFSIKTAGRQPGDFVVYRFSGSFRKTPLTLSQRVIERKGNEIMVDMTLEDGKKKRELRVRMIDEPGRRGDVLGVQRMESGTFKPAPIAFYEALMAETALAADENEGLLGTEDVKVTFGGTTTTAKKTSYRVRVGKKRATMRTFESTEFAWGDVGGEITADGGKVLYRAEVVKAGHAEPEASKAPGAVAIDE